MGSKIFRWIWERFWPIVQLIRQTSRAPLPSPRLIVNLVNLMKVSTTRTVVFKVVNMKKSVAFSFNVRLGSVGLIEFSPSKYPFGRAANIVGM